MARRTWKAYSVTPPKPGVYERLNLGTGRKTVEQRYWDGMNWYSKFNGLWWNKDFSLQSWRELKS